MLQVVRWRPSSSEATDAKARCAVHARLRFLNWEAPEDWALVWLATGATGGSLVVEGAVFMFDVDTPATALRSAAAAEDQFRSGPSMSLFGFDDVFAGGHTPSQPGRSSVMNSTMNPLGQLPENKNKRFSLFGAKPKTSNSVVAQDRALL